MKEQGKEWSSIVLWMKWQLGHFLKGKRGLVGKRDQEKQVPIEGMHEESWACDTCYSNPVCWEQSFYRNGSGEETRRRGCDVAWRRRPCGPAHLEFCSAVVWDHNAFRHLFISYCHGWDGKPAAASHTFKRPALLVDGLDRVSVEKSQSGGRAYRPAGPPFISIKWGPPVSGSC